MFRTQFAAALLVACLLQNTNAIAVRDNNEPEESPFSMSTPTESNLEASNEPGSGALFLDKEKGVIYEITTGDEKPKIPASNEKKPAAPVPGPQTSSVAQPKPNAVGSEATIRQDPSNLSVQDLVRMGLLQDEGEKVITIPKKSSSDFDLPGELMNLLSGLDRNSGKNFAAPQPQTLSNQGLNSLLGSRDYMPSFPQ